MTVFRKVTPGFHVSDFDRAVEFWTKVLGFEVTFTNGSPPCFAILKRDDTAIHFGVNTEKAGTGHCHFVVEGVDDLYSACKTAGVEIKQAPKEQSWGLRDMIIADPDGNTMEVGEKIP